mgnify:CR=1 FL=1
MLGLDLRLHGGVVVLRPQLLSLQNGEPLLPVLNATLHFAQIAIELVQCIAQVPQVGQGVLEFRNTNQQPIELQVMAGEGIGHRQPHCQHIGGNALLFHLTGQGCVEQGQGHQALAQATAQQFHIDGMAEIAQTPL